MRLRAVDGVVMPSPGLLHPYGTPFVLGEESGLGQRLGQFLGEDDVPRFLCSFVCDMCNGCMSCEKGGGGVDETKMIFRNMRERRG